MYEEKYFHKIEREWSRYALRVIFVQDNASNTEDIFGYIE